MSIAIKRFNSITSKSQWRYRQSTDKYVIQKHKFNYRARSAFKLYQLNSKFKFLKPSTNALDLGASPGGWAQVIQNALVSGTLIAVDLLPIEPIENTHIIEGDIREPLIQAHILKLLNGSKLDLITSDMAPSFTGNRSVDVPRVNELVSFAVSICESLLKKNGTMVAKYLDGDGEEELKRFIESKFSKVYYEKPKATRKESTERYIIAIGFK